MCVSSITLSDFFVKFFSVGRLHRIIFVQNGRRHPDNPNVILVCGEVSFSLY